MSKKKAIGIDLGTSKCCVGVVRDGKVEILENERGNKTTPSYVAFTDTERLVGDDAKDQATLNPKNTVLAVKRFMCKAVNDSAKMTAINAINEDGKACFKVTYKKNEQTLLPQQITAMLLTKMKSLAEDHLNSKVEEAVISVPASFSNAQRQATKDAATIAGLKVLALINEPTAAAIAYQTNRKTQGKETIVVVDFGAGKLDVSVVTVDDGSIRVKGVSGSTDIGGNDVDESLMSHIIDIYKKTFSNQNPLQGRAVMERLRSSCENIKRKLSLLPKVQETLDCFGEENLLQITMSRDEFNKMLPEQLFKCLIDCLNDSLNVARVGQEGISRVLLIGGSTRLIVIQEWLQECFKCPIDRSVNPDEAVAAGASVQAALLSRDHEVKELVVQGAIGTNFYLQHDANTADQMPIFGQDYLAAVPSKTVSLKHGLNWMHTYHVYEEFVGKKNSRFYYGSFLYSSDLCCRVDKCGIFIVCARDGQNPDGSLKWTDILNNVAGKLPKERLRKFVADEKKFREDEQEEKSRTEAMANLESLCFRYQSDLKKNQGTESFPESIHRFAQHVGENIEWLNSSASVSVTECRERKEIIEQEYKKVQVEIPRHQEQVEKERVASVTMLVKLCLELPYTLTGGDDKTLRELGSSDTLKALHGLIVKSAVPNITLSKGKCLEYIEKLQRIDTRRERPSNCGLPAEKSVDKSGLVHNNSGYQEESKGNSSVKCPLIQGETGDTAGKTTCGNNQCLCRQGPVD